jgi:hypothetical protein
MSTASCKSQAKSTVRYGGVSILSYFPLVGLKKHRDFCKLVDSMSLFLDFWMPSIDGWGVQPQERGSPPGRSAPDTEKSSVLTKQRVLFMDVGILAEMGLGWRITRNGD